MQVPLRGMSFREPHSRGPCRGFYTPGRTSGTRPAVKAAPPPANALLSVERMRAAFSSPTDRTTLLQQRVRTSGATMVALEGPAELSGDEGGQRQTQRAEPALSRASQNPPTSSAGRSSCGAREGNHRKLFSTAVATGPAATRASLGSVARPTSASVRAHAGARWNESGSASGAGAARRDSSGGSEPTLPEISRTY
jgi:hypothetical protein